MRNRNRSGYRRQEGRDHSIHRRTSGKAAGRGKGPAAGPNESRTGLDPFELFSAYHLGITVDKSFRPVNIHDVARRFGKDAGMIKQALQDHGMDPETMFDVEFDLPMAQVDIQVAPPGIDRLELAREIYAEFLKAPRKKRDWKKILSDDEQENSRIFGRKS